MPIKSVITVALLVLTFSVQGQTPKTNTSKGVQREFKNQGEQEDYWAEQLFANQYKKTLIKKYKGIITTSNYSDYKYGDRVLSVLDTPDSLKSIFKKGIFYPQILVGNDKAEHKTKEQIVAMSPGEKFFYYITKTDSVTISNFEECKFLSNDPKQKRFKFLFNTKAIANPTVYFVELTSSEATVSTPTEKFINGAVITFFKQGWVML